MQMGLEVQDRSGTDGDSSANGGAVPDHFLTTVDQHLMALFGFVQEPKEDFQRLVALGCDKYSYFAVGMWRGNIKIGCSNEPSRRVNELWRAPNGEDAKLAVVLRGRTFETCYHRKFAEHAIGNEWFAPHPDILAEIERLNGLPA